MHFGGGTPLTLGLPRLSALVRTLRRAFGSSARCEWAIETTVSSLDAAALDALSSLEFRRIHLGIQTLDDDTRRRIGRREPSAAALRLVRELIARGFFPSADLIIGLEGAGPGVVESDLRQLHEAGIRMFSVCELRGRAGQAPTPGEERERERRHRDLWSVIWAFMGEAGLQQIHLGQFGRSQADNLYYTHPARGENCVALGPYAHGSAGDVYYGNLLLEPYLTAGRSGSSPIAHGVRYGAAERPVLRLERDLLTNRVNSTLLDDVAAGYPDAFPPLVQKWLASGLLVESSRPGSFTLSREGSWFVGNMVEDGRAMRAAPAHGRHVAHAGRLARHASFLVPVLDRWLLHSPLHGVTALVNSGAARELRRGASSSGGGVLGEILGVLRRPPSNAPGPPEGEVCPSLLGLIPTRGCNLACGYCGFGGHASDRTSMDPAVAVAAVDWTARRLSEAGRRDFRLHFFGGEPFLAPDLVAVAVHRARSVADRYGVAPYIDASTNGVFDDPICEFVGDYFNGIAVSLDGPAEIHNRLRSRSGGRATFDDVNRTVTRLGEMPVELGLRACITELSAGDIESIVRWMIQAYGPSVVNLETLTPNAESERAGLRAPDPYRFAAGCVAACKTGEEHGVPVVYSAAERRTPRLSFCPVGTDALIVSPGGRISACYLRPSDWQARGLDLDVGRVEGDGTVRIDRAALASTRALPLRKPRCSRCFCQWTCAGGCHVNETFPGSSPGYSPFCVQTRIVTACLLLGDAGCSEMADALLADRRALERLAHHEWDPIDHVGRERPAALAGFADEAGGLRSRVEALREASV